MVTRSRKVPVVPGLAGLIDRLLELPTDLKSERIAMLNWRITTGSLRPDRYLQYQSERAKLTADPADWKDYAYSLGQLLKKEALKPGDDTAFNALEELVANKGMLGERSASIVLTYVEGLLERKNYRQAEQTLINLSVDNKILPENYQLVVLQLLDVRPEASWELHQAGFNHLIPAYASGKANWSQLLQRVERTHAYTRDLVDCLMNAPQMPKDEKLCTLTADRIMLLDESLIQEYLDRWRILLSKAGCQPPESALEAIERRRSGVSTGFAVPDAKFEEAVSEPAPLSAAGLTPDEAEGQTTGTKIGGLEMLLSGDQAESIMGAEDAEAVADTAVQPAAVELVTTAAPEPAVEIEAEQASAVLDATDAIAGDYSVESELEELEARDEFAADQSELHIAELNAADSDAVELAMDEAQSATAAPAAEIADATQTESETAVASAAGEVQPEPAVLVDADATAGLELAGVASRDGLRQRLDAWADGCAMDESCLAQLTALMAQADTPGWIAAESRMWLAEWLSEVGATTSAVEYLAHVETADPELAREYRARIGKLMAGEDPPQAVLATLGHLALVAEDYNAALSAALELPPDDAPRAKLLESLQERLIEASEPGPPLQMLLAQARRAAMHDPQAGFDVATTASLLALDDRAIQQLYAGWAAAVPVEVLHRQRAQQAVYLCVHQQRLELLAVALTEIEALAPAQAGVQDPLLIEWLEQLRPELEKLAPAQQREQRLSWTRLYLSQMVRAGQRERIPALLESAVEAIEPEAVLSLVSELATEIPAETRRAIEYESYLRQGAWERALDLALAQEETATAVIPLERIYDRLPAEALLPAGQRITQTLEARGDAAGQLHLVRALGGRIGGNGETADPGLRGFLDHVLSGLCERQFQPAMRYRLEQNTSDDPIATSRDLLALARQGDADAMSALGKLYTKLLQSSAPTDLLFKVAGELALADLDQALALLARAGLASGDVQQALAEIDTLGLAAETASDLVLLSQLVTAANDHPRMLDLARQLAAQNAYASAKVLVDAVVASEPDSDLAQMELIRLELAGETCDFKLATSNLLRLAQLYQERGIRPRQALEPLRPEIESACAAAADNQEAQHLKLTMLALSGELERAAQLVQQIMLRGPQAADGLLSLFERLAMEDAELPSPMLIAWGRALFRAGRIDDALSRMAGLRDAVGDFPEYAELLEEIKAAGGGPGACMQLGETYLRVHLWQRSAEEYAAALAQDPALAEPVLTQLRHHAALDPNPMKYPLHLLGLRAASGSTRQADWGWALSALTWLIPRWSAEELYGLAQALWEQHHRGDLDQTSRTELLLHLFKLANKLGRAEEALLYIGYAWEAEPAPTPELLAALGHLDESTLPETSPQWLALRNYQTQAAMLQAGAPAAVQCAMKLAAVSEDGRALALGMLARYQQSLEEPLPVMLARLRLLDLEDAYERETFVQELLAAAGGGLPREQVHSLISTVLELIHENVDNPDLAQLLLMLFRQLGDQSRAWQLALCYITGTAPPAPVAIESIHAVAADEFAIRQKIALVEIMLVRNEPTLAAEALEQLSWSNLGEHGPAAEELAEALLATPAAPVARRWLIGRLRDAGNATLAADHLLWTHARGNPQPAEWLNEQRNGDLLYRAAVLQELQNNPDNARRAYSKAHDAATVDTYIAASIRWRLSGLAEAAGDYEEARMLCEEVQQLIPEYPATHSRITTLSRAIAQRQIVAAREAEADSPTRTVLIVGLLRQIGDLNEAINELQSALSRNQNVPEVYIELAECFTDSADYPIARRAYHEVLKQLEHGGAVELKLRALYGLATAEEHLGSLDEAARCLEELLLIRRDYLDGKQRLARVQGKLTPAAPKRTAGKAGQIVDEIMLLLGVPEDEPGAPGK